jgi:ribosomal protein S1
MANEVPSAAATMNLGEWVRAEVFAAEAFGIWLRSPTGAEIFVHTCEVPWTTEISPREYCALGDVLDVKIVRFTSDGTLALGWLPWPDWHEGPMHDPDPP